MTHEYFHIKNRSCTKSQLIDNSACAHGLAPKNNFPLQIWKVGSKYYSILAVLLSVTSNLINAILLSCNLMQAYNPLLWKSIMKRNPNFLSTELFQNHPKRHMKITKATTIHWGQTLLRGAETSIFGDVSIAQRTEFVVLREFKGTLCILFLSWE